MKRWLVLFAVLSPNLSGCLFYAYPTVKHIPEQTVPNPNGNVQAFRVDIDATERPPLAPLLQYTLAKVRVNERGVVPSQLEVAPTMGIYNPLAVMEGSQHERSEYTMQVRLYRPGFNVQTVKAWDKSRDLHWTAAPDLLAQEKALDDLLAVPSTPGQTVRGTWWELRDDKNVNRLPPGGVSAGHADALRFAAAEYDRLAKSPLATPTTMQSIRDRLVSKAQWLRTYAERPAETP